MSGDRRFAVVVTGAASGIGQATAEAFAARGAALELTARDGAALDAVARRCRDLGGEVSAHVLDSTDADGVEAFARQAAAMMGGIDLWLSNPGVGAIGRIEQVPPAAHARVIDTTLTSHLYEARAVLPIFRAQGGGIFVNMISVGGIAAAPFAASYSAAKFGLVGLSEALRGETWDAPGIHICDVYPAFVDTPGLVHAGNYSGKALARHTAMPLIDARTVAANVVALADDPKPTTLVGGSAHLIRALHGAAPHWLMRRQGRALAAALARADPGPRTAGNLFAPPAEAGGIDGGLNPARGTGLGWLALGVAAAGTAALLAR